MIFNQIVPAGGIKICASTADTSFAVTATWFCNTSEEVAEILSVYLVASNGEIANSNQIVCKMSIKPMDTMVFDTEKIILEQGDYLYAKSSNGTVSATVSVMKL